MLMNDTRHVPVYYFPFADMRFETMARTDHHSHCPYKGDASYWSVHLGDRVAENAVWSYQDPFAEVPFLDGYAAFYWNRMDHWYEEDEEVFVHARDPYKRIDVVASSRPVRVVLGGETVAETTRAQFLFETGMPTRYYIPPDDVRMDLLTPSETRSGCPYKGSAVYWSAEIGGDSFAEIVWSYPDPVAECPRIAGLMCFFDEHVDAVFVDGEQRPRPETPWSRR